MQTVKDFGEIFEEHKLMVLNLALQYTQNLQDAEEITQDVFVKVYDKLHTFNNQSSIKTWIYRITIHQSLDFIKARNRKKRAFWIRFLAIDDTTNQNIPHVMNHPGIILEEREATEKIFRALNRLPDQQKTAIIMVKIEQTPVEEAAHILGMNKKALESLIHRAKKNLEKNLAEQRKSSA